MSVAVSLADLAAHVVRFALGPYLVTVGLDGTARVTSVSVRWQGDLLVAGVGGRTAANVRANPAVTLVWPAPVPGQYALIADGSAEVHESSDAGLAVLIRPEKAVLHVTRTEGLASSGEGRSITAAPVVGLAASPEA